MNNEVMFISNPYGGGHWEVDGVRFEDWSDAVEYSLELHSEEMPNA